MTPPERASIVEETGLKKDVQSLDLNICFCENVCERTAAYVLSGVIKLFDSLAKYIINFASLRTFFFRRFLDFGMKYENSEFWNR